MLFQSRNVFLLKLLFLLVNLVKSAKILGVFPSAGYSQYILGESLLIALAEKGHDVTSLAAFETKSIKNIRNIKVDLSEFESDSSLFQLHDFSLFTNQMLLVQLGLSLTERVLNDSKVQNIINSNETFDIVIVETFMNDALLTLAKHFNAHLILFSSNVICEWNSHLIGNLNLPSIMPSHFIGYTTSMTFFQRFRNTLSSFMDYYLKYFHRYPTHQILIDKYFPKKYNLKEIMYNASMLIQSTHVSTSEPYSLTSGVVEVGGLHIKARKLPEKFQQFLDSAADGAVLFSMGTYLKSAQMPNDTIKSILDFVRHAKQKFIWKFESGVLENIPNNLLISKWVPQSDILRHPQIIAFISHCGYGGSTEAIYHGIPVVAIPVFADQFMNAERMIKFGMAVKLPYKKLSGETLGKALNEIIDNSNYAENAKIRSKICHDRPIEPLDLAVYSVEYVLRHNGAHHLKNSAQYLTWYQLYLIDVFGTIIVVPYLLSVIIRKIVKHLY